ncbi:hypothetical protein HPO_06032 [Hyphomonas polymorpha PS728]|uniref:Uncharacterized protein n=1 Tax=Hyphomonas polymorpha PS728 TaxID=1280954 RepID=A0A062VMS2_9PROT|nr:hypothetical protein [Hyphomonas sp. CACIAM 19H1]AXE63983.1 hypothetical protein BBF93_06930 [Hyphomonas sp. CACIAM 19H1]KCZ99472.1 hypothetical protein HPO_06032 [Hyphomonas polymorpha PS728]
MKKTPLDRLAMPRTSLSFALQSLASARRRWRQMIPGAEPVGPPGEEVSHYSGRPEDAVLGGGPESPVGKISDK